MDETLNKKTLMKLMDQIVNTFEIPIYFVYHNDQIETVLPEVNEINALFSRVEAVIRELAASHQISFPRIHETKFKEVYLVVKLPEALNGTLIAGPSYAGFPIEIQRTILLDNGISTGIHDRWFQYYESMPVMTPAKLANVGSLIYFFLFRQTIDAAQILYESHVHNSKNKKRKQLDMVLASQRNQMEFHHDLELEKNLNQLIKSGKKKEALEAYMSIPKELMGTLSHKSYLRSRKNFALCVITLWTRAAINGGLNWERAFTMSDLYIQRIEELNEIDEVERTITDALLDFSDRNHRSRDQELSHSIRLCQNYIMKNIYQKITLEQLGEICGLAPGYLSQLFIKETGIPVSEYIQKERIEEAKRLLIHSEGTISEISFILNFNDQSYFTKVFKRAAGFTPKQFRDHYKLEI